MSDRGGKRYGSGRRLQSPDSFLKSFEKREQQQKAWRSDHDRIYLKKNVHGTWKSLKSSCEYYSDNAFAKHLLSLELRRQSSVTSNRRKRSSDTKNVSLTIASCSGRPEFDTNTPVKGMKSESNVFSCLQESPIFAIKEHKDSSSECDVNVTGFTINTDESPVSDSSDTLSESDDDIYLDSTVLDDALEALDEDIESSSTSSDEDNDEEFWGEDSEPDEQEELSKSLDESPSNDFELSGYLPDEPDDECPPEPPLVISISTQTDELSDAMMTSNPIPYVKCPLRENKFNRWDEHSNFQDELKLVQSTKVICALDLLVQSFSEKCRHPCCQLRTNVEYTLCGASVILTWKCSDGHFGKFYSSHKHNGVLANNLQTSAAILLSGNNFSKIEKFAEFLGLSFVSKSTFYRVQRLYMIPGIAEWWNWQQRKMFAELQGKDLVICGDGQCDSPGFTSKNLCYFVMEMTTDYIIDLEIFDKREVDMKSVNMEKEALNNILKRLKDNVKLVELVTDASSSVKKLIATNFCEIFHSLDVWHKAKSIKKCITKTGGTKGMEKLNSWSEHIINHFWYCCSTASEGTDTDKKALHKMKDMWISLLHHVCDEHEWLGGKCSHDDLPEEERKLPWFDRRSKDFEALQKIILQPKLLESFPYYTRFRHTGALERANSMSLMYATKRCAFTKNGYTARKRLAAIDWNYHLDIKTKKNSYGEISVTRKYNQRTKKWNLKILKEKKDYGYIWMLLAKIFRLRSDDEKNMQQVVPMDVGDPRNIAPTIAQCESVSAHELYEKHRTRFT